jgi:DNA-binding transcriptional regulator YdaS (Cro superfamily)
MSDVGISALRRAIEILGSQAAVATAIGKSQQSVSEIARRGKRVPAEWCLPIEEATNGRISRHDLRPDLYPFATPEEKFHPPHQPA